MAEVDVLTAQPAHLRQLDCHHGSGRLRAQLVQRLHRQVSELRHGSYSAATGQALLSALAQACWLAGFLVWDQMGRMTSNIARGASTEDDQLRNALQTVALTRAGLSLTQASATPLLVTHCTFAEGHGLGCFYPYSGGSVHHATAGRPAALRLPAAG